MSFQIQTQKKYTQKKYVAGLWLVCSGLNSLMGFTFRPRCLYLPDTRVGNYGVQGARERDRADNG